KTNLNGSRLKWAFACEEARQVHDFANVPARVSGLVNNESVGHSLESSEDLVDPEDLIHDVAGFWRVVRDSKNAECAALMLDRIGVDPGVRPQPGHRVLA